MSKHSESTAHTRFWTKVDKSGDCWVWTGAKTKKGYGIFRESMRQAGGLWRAHRWAWREANGPIPDGMEVDHECRNRACVRPSHLRLATSLQNKQNRRCKGASGVMGVRWYRGKWQAAITHAGRHHYLGRFDDIDEAAAVVDAKRRELQTHYTG